MGLETDVSRNMIGRNRALTTLDHSENSVFKAREFKTWGMVGVVLNFSLPVSDVFGPYLKPLVGSALNSIFNLFLLLWLRRATAWLKTKHTVGFKSQLCHLLTKYPKVVI